MHAGRPGRRRSAVGVGRGARAGLADREPDLLVLLADLVLAGRAQGRHAARAAVVGVGGAHHAEHVAAVRHVVGVGAGRPSSPSCLPQHGRACHARARTSTCTSEQLTVPSSGSVTVTVNGMLSPKANVPPSTGVLTTTVGLVLPTVITVLVEFVLPDESVTVAAVHRPDVV